MTAPAWPDVPATLLVLAPHPDDDVLGCARLMQRVAAAGGAVVIVWLTDGGASHGELTAQARAALVARRRAEALAGVQALGVTPAATHFLGVSDGTLARHVAAARGAVADICRRHQVEIVAVTDREDGHSDHRAAYAIALGLDVPRLVAYPVSGRYDGDAYAPPAGVLCLPALPGDRKRAALLAHRSQMEPQALCPLSLATIARFCAEPEFFIPVRRMHDA